MPTVARCALRRFRGFDWNALMHKKLQAPIVPHAQSEDDTSYFDEYPEEVPCAAHRPLAQLAPRTRGELRGSPEH